MVLTRKVFDVKIILLKRFTKFYYAFEFLSTVFLNYLRFA